MEKLGNYGKNVLRLFKPFSPPTCIGIRSHRSQENLNKSLSKVYRLRALLCTNRPKLEICVMDQHFFHRYQDIQQTLIPLFEIQKQNVELWVIFNTCTSICVLTQTWLPTETFKSNLNKIGVKSYFIIKINYWI